MLEELKEKVFHANLKQIFFIIPSPLKTFYYTPYQSCIFFY